MGLALRSLFLKESFECNRLIGFLEYMKPLLFILRGLLHPFLRASNSLVSDEMFCEFDWKPYILHSGAYIIRPYGMDVDLVGFIRIN